MNSVIETITAVEDQIVEAVESAQQPVVDAIKQVADLFEGILPDSLSNLPTLPFADALPAPTELLDTQYAFVQRLLEANHRFAKAVIDAYTPAVVATPAPKASAKTAKAA